MQATTQEIKLAQTHTPGLGSIRNIIIKRPRGPAIPPSPA